MTEIRYHLPETRVTLSGVIEHVTTTFASPPVSTAIQMSSGVAWQTAADQDTTATLALDAALLQDRLTKISFTADRRLTGFASSVTGKIDAFVKAGVKAGVMLASIGMLMSEREAPKATTAEFGYDRDQPDASRDLARLRSQLAQARTRLSQRRSQLLTGPVEELVKPETAREIDVFFAFIEQLESEVDSAVGRFNLWKDAHTSTATEHVEAVLELRQLPRWDGEAIDWSDAANARPGELGAQDIWDRLGFVLARLTPRRSGALARTDGHGIVVRIPRLAAFAVLRRGDTSAVVLTEQIIHRWVMDDGCDTEFLTLERTFAGKRELTLDFDDGGALISVAKTSESGAANVVTGALDGLNEGLASAKTAADTIDGFLNHAAAVHQARITQQLAVAKAEVELAGLGATKTEQANLARLAQLAGSRS